LVNVKNCFTNTPLFLGFVALLSSFALLVSPLKQLALIENGLKKEGKCGSFAK
jgi:hypothetical protein